MNSLEPREQRGNFVQRAVAVAMILIQCLTLYFGMRAKVFPTFAAAIALGGLLANQRQMTRDIRWGWSVVLLAIVFVARYLYSPVEFSFAVDFVNTSLAYEIVCFLISIQLLVLFARQFEKRIPAWFLGLAAFAMIFSMDARYQNFLHRGVLVLVVGFVGLMGLFSNFGRRFQSSSTFSKHPVRSILLLSCIIGGLSAGAAGSILIRRYDRTLEATIAKYLSGQGSRPAGFSGSGGLSDILANQLTDGELVALRIISKNPPGYLRGRVFDRFDHDLWNVTTPAKLIGAANPPPITTNPRPADNQFVIKPRAPISTGNFIDVWPDPGERAVFMFLPQETHAICTAAPALTVDPIGVVSRDVPLTRSPYTVYLSDVNTHVAAPLNVEEYAKWLQIPDELDPPIIELARQLTANDSGYAEKVASIETFFAQNFNYKIGFIRRRGETALGQFLLSDRAAHCEYFATSTVLLLRLAGIPARYVTGYVAPEWNAHGEFWVARKKHSHAWVEAYDAVTQTWKRIDTTPGDGLPVADEAAAANGLWEARLHQWHQWVLWFKGIQFGNLFSWSSSNGLLILVCATIGYVAYRTFTGAGLFGFWKRRVILEDAGPPLLVRERDAFDKFLEKRGWRRRGDETVLDFADRIEREAPAFWAVDVSHWYREYTRARFGLLNAVDFSEDLKTMRRQLQATRFKVFHFGGVDSAMRNEQA